MFKAALLDVADSVPGRMQLLQQTALALLSRRHQLLISRAGTGKSLYGDTVFSHFEGVTFKAQFTQGTRVETILGTLRVTTNRGLRCPPRTRVRGCESLQRCLASRAR